MAYKIPEYIGYPGWQSNEIDSQLSMQFKNDMEKRFQIAYLRPRDIQASLSANIYKPANDTDSWVDYCQYLRSNNIIPSAQVDSDRILKVVLNAITPLGETYSNEYGQSSLLSGINNVFGESGNELAFMTGIRSFNDLKEKTAGSSNSLVSKLGKGIDTIDTALSDFAGGLGGENGKAMYNTIKNSMLNPNSKLDFPQFWKSAGYSCSYELSIRLYCYNVTDENYYNSAILASYGALLQFVVPRSEDGNLYTWPFLMEFEIPGLVHLPMAFCSNITVVKGGDVNDISLAYRPNIIDLRMTINPVYNVMYNISNKYSKYEKVMQEQGLRPSLLNELTTLSKMRTFDEDGNETITQHDLLDNFNNTAFASQEDYKNWKSRNNFSEEDLEAMTALNDAEEIAEATVNGTENNIQAQA